MAGAGRLAQLSASVRERFDARLPDGGLQGGAVVALSGGADSAVCLWAAAATGAPVRAAFVNHGFPESPQMAEAAAAVAEACGVALTMATVVVETGPSPEAQARAARHAALGAVVGDGEALLSGHTADDQAETVLGNLLRGAGAEGLAGIPARRGPWVRPLLDVTRAETRELATLLRLPFRDDPANEAAEPRRNVIRRELIPDLEARFNPGLRGVLRRTAEILGRDDRLLDEAARRVPMRVDGRTVRLPAPLLATLPEPVAARAVRAGLRMVRGPHSASEREVAQALAMTHVDVAYEEFVAGVVAAREGPWLALFHDPGHQPWNIVSLDVPGSLQMPEVSIDAWIEDRAPSPWPLGRGTVVLDADAVGKRVVVRPCENTGRIAIAAGSKAVGDALAEAGVPGRRRAGWPVVAAGERLVWLVGVRAAEWARPGPETKRFAWFSARLREVP